MYTISLAPAKLNYSETYISIFTNKFDLGQEAEVFFVLVRQINLNGTPE